MKTIIAIVSFVLAVILFAASFFTTKMLLPMAAVLSMAALILVILDV